MPLRARAMATWSSYITARESHHATDTCRELQWKPASESSAGMRLETEVARAARPGHTFITRSERMTSRSTRFDTSAKPFLDFQSKKRDRSGWKYQTHQLSKKNALELSGGLTHQPCGWFRLSSHRSHPQLA